MYQELKLCIATEKVDKVNETLKVMVCGKGYWIKMKEVKIDVEFTPHIVDKDTCTIDSNSLSDEEVSEVPNFNFGLEGSELNEENQPNDTHISYNIQEKEKGSVEPDTVKNLNTEEHVWNIREKTSSTDSQSLGQKDTSEEKSLEKLIQVQIIS